MIEDVIKSANEMEDMFSSACVSLLLVLLLLFLEGLHKNYCTDIGRRSRSRTGQTHFLDIFHEGIAIQRSNWCHFSTDFWDPPHSQNQLLLRFMCHPSGGANV